MRACILLFGVVALSLPASAQGFTLPGAGGKAKRFEDVATVTMAVTDVMMS